MTAADKKENAKRKVKKEAEAKKRKKEEAEVDGKSYCEIITPDCYEKGSAHKTTMTQPTFVID